MLRDFRQHHLCPFHSSAPKTSPRASHPAVTGSGQGHPRSRAGTGPPQERRMRGGGWALLTPPERFPQTSQTCWNCRSSQFWRCRRIPARGSPPGSARGQEGEPGVSPPPGHPKAPRPQAVPPAGTHCAEPSCCASSFAHPNSRRATPPGCIGMGDTATIPGTCMHTAPGPHPRCPRAAGVRWQRCHHDAQPPP